jgi:hypothetical protein
MWTSYFSTCRGCWCELGNLGFPFNCLCHWKDSCGSLLGPAKGSFPGFFFFSFHICGGAKLATYKAKYLYIHPHYGCIFGCKIQISPFLILFSSNFAFFIQFFYNPWLIFGFFIQKNSWIFIPYVARKFIVVLSSLKMKPWSFPSWCKNNNKLIHPKLT